MPNSKSLRAAALLFATLAMACTATCAILFGALWRIPPEDTRSYRIVDLLLDVSDFPPGWQASEAGPMPPASAPLGGQKSIERISFGFLTNNGVAVQEVHRYSSVQAASQEFDRQLPLRFPQGEFWTPWMLPPNLDYQSLYADRYLVACAHDPVTGQQESCRMLGQFGEYIVRFGAHIGTNMTYEDFENLLRAIDERMAITIVE